MVEYIKNITPYSQGLLKKGYQGRSPYDEYLYGSLLLMRLVP